MHHLVKELFELDSNDSATVQALKVACNELIEHYNCLENPLKEQGQELVVRINAYIMKVHELKESHYQSNR